MVLFLKKKNMFWEILSSHVFPAWGTSRSFDRCLTTIKNSYKQGMLLGRVQEEGKRHVLFRPLSHFPERNSLFPNLLKKKKTEICELLRPELWAKVFSQCSAHMLKQCFDVYKANAWRLTNYSKSHIPLCTDFECLYLLKYDETVQSMTL